MSFEFLRVTYSNGFDGHMVLPKKRIIRELCLKGFSPAEAEIEATLLIRDDPALCSLCGSRLDSMDECPIHG